MRFLPPDEEVDLYCTAFSDDLLGRVKIGKALSDVIENIDDPLVVAVDGRWGTGKSYFLKRWAGAHRLQNNGKAVTVYFDAFSHDYLSDPLIALVSALSRRMPSAEESKLDRLKRVAFKFVKPATRVGLALATYGATEAFNGFGDAAVEAGRGEAEKAVDGFWRIEEGRQAAMDEFRAAIKSLTNSNKQENFVPLVIIIDELDRCRPDYALELLEIIKHFFSVMHVHFVLGVNLKALENSIKVRYGSGIDATAYLQKFLSLTISLPDHIGDQERTPSVIQYVEHLGSVMGTPKHLLSEICTQLKIIQRSNIISIRDVGKIMSNLSLLPVVARGDNLYEGWRMAMITMIITRVLNAEFFEKLVNLSFDEKDLILYFNAENNYIDELINGKPNFNYDHNTALIFEIWVYIRREGVLDDKARSDILSRSFGRPRQIKQIPRKIYEDWLNVFEFS